MCVCARTLGGMTEDFMRNRQFENETARSRAGAVQQSVYEYEYEQNDI